MKPSKQIAFAIVISALALCGTLLEINGKEAGGVWAMTFIGFLAWLLSD